MEKIEKMSREVGFRECHGTLEIPLDNIEEFKQRFIDNYCSKKWCLFHNLSYVHPSTKDVAEETFKEMFELN